jgi:hypothetical protein
MGVSDIITTPCKIYYGTYGATLPADTVAAGGAWPAGWTALGYTKTPLSVSFTRELVEEDIQESLAIITKQAKKEEFMVETTMAEFVLTELLLGWGGANTTTAAGAGQPGMDEMVGGDDTALVERAWGFEGSYVSAAGNVHPIRLFLYKGVAEFGNKLEFGKADPTGVPLKVKANPDMTKAAGQRLYMLQKMTAPAT